MLSPCAELACGTTLIYNTVFIDDPGKTRGRVRQSLGSPRDLELRPAPRFA